MDLYVMDYRKVLFSVVFFYCSFFFIKMIESNMVKIFVVNKIELWIKVCIGIKVSISDKIRREILIII